MPRLPGHRYLGPGNTLNEGDPVDEDDDIARYHDLAYEQAKGNSDKVRAADLHAIGEFAVDASARGNQHSLAGAAGLGIKYLAERLVGVQYSGGNVAPLPPKRPRLQFPGGAPKKRPFDDTARPKNRPVKKNKPPVYHTISDSEPEDQEEGPPDLHPFPDSPYQEEQLEPPTLTQMADSAGPVANPLSNNQAGVSGAAADEPMEYGRDGSGSATGGNDGEGSVKQLIVHNIRLSPHSVPITFKRKWIIQVPSFQWAAGTIGGDIQTGGNVISNISTCLHSPLSLIPANCLALYMTPSQFDELPRGSYATNCRIAARPREFRTPFQTGNQVAAYANAHIGLSLIHNTGLNLMYPSFYAKYTPSLDDPTKPKIENLDDSNYQHRLWGTNSGRDDTHISAAFNVPRHLNRYLNFLPGIHRGTGGSEVINGDTLIGDFVQSKLFNAYVGQDVLNYNYDFKCGLLKWKVPFQDVNARTDTGGSFGFDLPAPCLGHGKVFAWGTMAPNFEQDYPQDYGDPDDVTWTTSKYFNTECLYRSNIQNSAATAGAPERNRLKMFDYNARIEKSDYVCNSFKNTNWGAAAMPLPHVGLMPLYSSGFASPTPGFAEIVSTWEIEAELNIMMPFYSSLAREQANYDCNSPVYQKFVLDNTAAGDKAFADYLSSGGTQLHVHGLLAHQISSEPSMLMNYWHKYTGLYRKKQKDQ